MGIHLDPQPKLLYAAKLHWVYEASLQSRAHVFPILGSTRETEQLRLPLGYFCCWSQHLAGVSSACCRPCQRRRRACGGGSCCVRRRLWGGQDMPWPQHLAGFSSASCWPCRRERRACGGGIGCVQRRLQGGRDMPWPQHVSLVFLWLVVGHADAEGVCAAVASVVFSVDCGVGRTCPGRSISR